MRLALLFLLACDPSKAPSDTEMDTDTDAEIEEVTDADGDGVTSDEDCDDADPDAVLYRVWDSSLTYAEADGLCDGRCAVKVWGDLVVEDTDATDLSRLSCIDEVAGSVAIARNPALTDLSGLDGLTGVGVPVLAHGERYPDGGELTIRENGALEHLDGLGRLVTVNGDLTIEDNAALESISTFNNLTMNESVIIRDNTALTTLSGLNDLTTDDLELLEVSGSPALAHITGLGGADLVVDAQTLVRLVGLSSLTSLEFLTGVVEVSSLELRQDDALVDLAGLESMGAVIVALDIEDNDGLGDLSALYGLALVRGDLTVLENDALPTGAAAALVAEIDYVVGEVVIQD